MNNMDNEQEDCQVDEVTNEITQETQAEGKTDKKSVPTVFGRRMEDIASMLDANHRVMLRKLAGIQALMVDLPPGDIMTIRGHAIPYITKNQMLQVLRELLLKETMTLLPPQQMDVTLLEGNRVMVTTDFLVADIDSGYVLRRTYRETASNEGDNGISTATGKAFRSFLQGTFHFTMGSTADKVDAADPEMIPTAEVMANGALEDIVQALRLKASTAISKVGFDKAMKRIKEKGQFVTTTDPEQMNAQECLTVISAVMDLVGVGSSTKDKLRKIVDQAGSEGLGGE
jgi:hypothetical protein